LESNGAAWRSRSWTTLIDGVPVQSMVAFQIWSLSGSRPVPSKFIATIGFGAPAGGAVAPSASAGRMYGRYGST
jgi:hypothetical protein